MARVENTDRKEKCTNSFSSKVRITCATNKNNCIFEMIKQDGFSKASKTNIRLRSNDTAL